MNTTTEKLIFSFYIITTTSCVIDQLASAPQWNRIKVICVISVNGGATSCALCTSGRARISWFGQRQLGCTAQGCVGSSKRSIQFEAPHHAGSARCILFLVIREWNVTVLESKQVWYVASLIYHSLTENNSRSVRALTSPCLGISGYFRLIM